MERVKKRVLKIVSVFTKRPLNQWVDELKSTMYLQTSVQTFYFFITVSTNPLM